MNGASIIKPAVKYPDPYSNALLLKQASNLHKGFSNLLIETEDFELTQRIHNLPQIVAGGYISENGHPNLDYTK